MENFDVSSLKDAVDPQYAENKNARAKEMAEDGGRSEADKNWAAYVRMRDPSHLDWVKTANKYDDFYQNNQWDEKDLKKLEADGRPALTINHILPVVKSIVGEQTSRRMDVQYKPEKDGSNDTAFALTKLFVDIDQQNKLDWVETEVFTDGIITDRGYFDARMSTETNVFGDVEIKARDPRTVLLPTDAVDYDPKTWREVATMDWLSMDDIVATYGQKVADKVKGTIETDETGIYGPESVIFKATRFGGEKTDEWKIDAGKYEGKYIRKILVISRQHARFERKPHFFDPVSGDVKPVPVGWDEEKVATFSQRFGLGIVKRTTRVIYWTDSTQTCLLNHEQSPYRSFTVIPFFPIFRRGKPCGVVRYLISPQEQVNKLESQELHIVNTTANSGWMVEDGSLANMSADDLRSRGAETGIVIEYNRGTVAPDKITPNQIPTGIDRIAAKAANNIKAISSVNDTMLASDSPEVSGVAMRVKQFRGRIQMAGPEDNLARTRHLLAEKVLELVQDFYTEERLINYVDAGDPNDPNKTISINHIDAVGDIINDVSVGKYKVSIGTMPAREAFQESQFAEAIELREAGIAIPDDVVVENTTLQHKDQIAERMRQQQGLGTQSEEEQQMAQFQQDMALRMQMLELETAQAELAKLEGEAQLASAKAAKEINTDNRQIEELEARIQQKREELDLRRQLAALSSKTKLTQVAMQNDARTADKIMDSLNQRPQ